MGSPYSVYVSVCKVLGTGAPGRLVLYDCRQCMQGGSVCGALSHKEKPGAKVAQSVPGKSEDIHCEIRVRKRFNTGRSCLC